MRDIKGTNDLTKHLLVGISELGCRAWRNNVGGAYPIQTVKAVKGMLSDGNVAGAKAFLNRSKPMIFGGLPGLPDIMGIMPGGRLLGVEVKWGDDTQSEEQKVCQSVFDKLGALYIIARNYEETMAEIRKGSEVASLRMAVDALTRRDTRDLCPVCADVKEPIDYEKSN